MNRRYLLVPLVAVCLALLPTTASATTTYTEPVVVGAETGQPTPCVSGNGNSLSSFAGLAFGTINGTFTASVCHTALSSGGSAGIVADPAGVFTLTNGSTTVSGAFTTGGITHKSFAYFSRLCVEKFAVIGSLSNGGSFDATLTHYAYGSCSNVFFATVVGSAVVNA
jgi:hypothetical protein